MLTVQKPELHSKHKQDKAPKSTLQLRWWSQFEVIKQDHDLFGDIPDFLDTADLPLVTRKKLIDICGQPQQQALLKIELAATVDAIEPFVKATYNLEGDGPLALQAYHKLRTVESHIANALVSLPCPACSHKETFPCNSSGLTMLRSVHGQHINITKTNLFMVHFSHWP